MKATYFVDWRAAWICCRIARVAVHKTGLLVRIGPEASGLIFERSVDCPVSIEQVDTDLISQATRLASESWL